MKLTENNYEVRIAFSLPSIFSFLEDGLKVAILLRKGKAFGNRSPQNTEKSLPECFAPTANGIN